MSGSTAQATSISEVLSFSLDISKSKNIFAVHVGVLLLLAYILAVVVSVLHKRQNPVVFPLTRPQQDVFFSEYIIKVKTSLRFGSTLDSGGRAIIQLLGSFGDSVPLHLKKGKGVEFFLERGATNIFVYHCPYVLGDIEEIKITMVNDAPHEKPFVSWRPSYISVLHPDTDTIWGCFPKKEFRAYDVFADKVVCKSGLRDEYGLFKAICLFHPWLSVFNSPQRFGTYSNLINAVVVFFGLACMLTCALLFELSFSIKVIPGTHQALTTYLLLRSGLAAFVVWIIEIMVEVFLRNTVSHVSPSRYGRFQGLLEPVASSSRLTDFTIVYDWDQVRPLLAEKRVLFPYGRRHKGAQSVFPVPQPPCFYNLWGLFNPENERTDSWYLWTLHFCALPLPASLKWLSTEAVGKKEALLVKHYLENFRTPACYFCSWLLDWPLHYYLEPQQAGLIISHIIFRDLLAIVNMRNRAQRARLAQISVHQWHGMICCIFLFIIKQSIEQRSEPASELRSFMFRTMTQFGKRSAREIQAAWRIRQQLLKALEYRKFVAPEDGDDVSGRSFSGSDENISAQRFQQEAPDHVGTLRQSIKFTAGSPRRLQDYSERHHSTYSMNHEYREDHLIFEDLMSYNAATRNPAIVGGSGFISSIRDRWDLLRTFPPQDAPIYNVVQEGINGPRSEERMGESIGTRREIHQPNTDISLSEVEMGAAINDTVHLDMNINAKSCDNNKPNDTVNKENIHHANFSMKCSEESSENQENNYGDKEESEIPVREIKNPARQNRNMNAADDRGMTKKRFSFKELTERRSSMFAANRRESLFEKSLMAVAEYEQTTIGTPFNASVEKTVDPTAPHYCLRDPFEIGGYCCNDERCQANLQIHKKVGHSSLEVLKKLLLEVLYFAMDNNNIKQRSKLWLRKKMVLDLFDVLRHKAEFYSDAEFQDGNEPEYHGFNCIALLTSIFTILEVVVDMTILNQERSKVRNEWERNKKYGIPSRPVLRCLYCARDLRHVTNLAAGCDKMEKLVTFFSRETISVAEMELTTEFQHKLSLQRYCALIMNLAKREILVELEDPPSVLATKVLRAMIHKLLDEMIPKPTDFKEMSADELRRMGTRRERIQARHDPRALANKKESLATKRRKQIITQLLESLGNKWKISARENYLDYCARLLAQILVHERIMGFSIYSGFITKEHEALLDSSRARLWEVEKKAFDAVLKIARYELTCFTEFPSPHVELRTILKLHSPHKDLVESLSDQLLKYLLCISAISQIHCENNTKQRLLLPTLRKTLRGSRELDVVFCSAALETLYLEEAICVFQVQQEPIFLKTSCYYIRDIINKKVEEFKEFMGYMKQIKPKKDLKSAPALKLLKTRYEIDGKIKFMSAPNLSSICSPILRWGPVAIKGVPPIPSHLKAPVLRAGESFDNLLQQAIESGSGDEKLQFIVTNIMKTRRKVKSFLDVQAMERQRKLQLHLARVQARLTEQIALVSQSISDQYVLETDYQREYHRDDLFNVELYATGKLYVPIARVFGAMLIYLLIIITLLAMFFTTFKGSVMALADVTKWAESGVFCILIYLAVLEPLKCIIYYLFRLFVD